MEAANSSIDDMTVSGNAGVGGGASDVGNAAGDAGRASKRADQLGSAGRAKKRKRILIYGTNYYPEPIGIPRYTTDMAETMAAEGHDVTVVAAAPLYPTWTRQLGYRYRWYSRDERNGVTIYRTPTYVPRGSGFSQRVIYELIFCLTSMPLVIYFAFRSLDALIVTSPPLVICWAFLLPTRVRKVAIIKDFQIEIAENLQIVRNRKIIAFLYRIERFLLDRADLITCVSIAMVKRIERKLALSRSRVVTFPDWVDVDRLKESTPLAAQQYKERLSLPLDKIVVGYSGNLARKQGIELLAEIARRFHEKGRSDVHFLVCGDGPAKQDFETLVRELKLPNITLVPLQPEADLPVLLSLIDVHVVLQREEVNDLVMPGKMFNTMSCSRPLVITAPKGSAIEGVIQQSGGGLCLERKDDVRLETTIDALCRNGDLRRELGRRGRAWVEKHMAKRAILDQFFADSLS